jgi:hypothetical protein
VRAVTTPARTPKPAPNTQPEHHDNGRTDPSQRPQPPNGTSQTDTNMIIWVALAATNTDSLI